MGQARRRSILAALHPPLPSSARTPGLSAMHKVARLCDFELNKITPYLISSNLKRTQQHSKRRASPRSPRLVNSGACDSRLRL